MVLERRSDNHVADIAGARLCDVRGAEMWYGHGCHMGRLEVVGQAFGGRSGSDCGPWPSASRSVAVR